MDSQVLLPMTMGLPMVASLKCFSSPGRCQGNLPFIPIPRLPAMAAMRVIFLPRFTEQFTAAPGSASVHY